MIIMMHPPRWHFIDVNHINNVPSIRLYVPKKRQEIWVGIYKEREREREREKERGSMNTNIQLLKV